MRPENQPHLGWERLEERLAGFLRVHARRPGSPSSAPSKPFSARLALERAFVAAPTD